ncbi:MAG: von Willebrand factor, type [Bryobacterales bacterium]|jgi:Ca-activated chloride channel family protein|nr:von Willebrand factor, type [Bryobacterales bacterium]
MSRLQSKWLAAGLLIAGVAAVTVRAQEEPPTFRTEIKEVTLHVSVTDKSGKLVTNIPRSAFKVYEDNVEQPIKLFRREDVPVSMGILVDNSGSMNDKRARVAAAALALVKASNPDDEVFIVNFNDDPYLDQSFTHDTKKMEEALSRIDARGGTAMRNAISGAIDYMKTDAKLDKKVLVVVTDGNDNASTETTLEQLLRKVRDSGVLVYSIGLLNEEEAREARAAKRALNSLAETSAGASYYPKDLAEVEKLTPEIAHEIRNQYTIAYSPLNDNLDGSFRKIKVELAGQYRGATVRAKNGYYATSDTPKKSAVSLGKP